VGSFSLETETRDILYLPELHLALFEIPIFFFVSNSQQIKLVLSDPC